MRSHRRVINGRALALYILSLSLPLESYIYSLFSIPPAKQKQASTYRRNADIKAILKVKRIRRRLRIHASIYIYIYICTNLPKSATKPEIWF